MTDKTAQAVDPLWFRASRVLTDYRSTALPLGARLVFAVAALGLLLDGAPWRAVHPLAAAATVASFLYFGALAVTGLAPGRPRQACYALGLAYVVLVACKLLFVTPAWA